MLRLVFLVSTMAAGCGPTCDIPGIYIGHEVAIDSGNCTLDTNTMATDTFTLGSNGKTASIVIQGISGSCSGEISNTCTWTASCPVSYTNPDGSSFDVSTQYSWTFDDNGFSGTSATSVQGGCTGTISVAGDKQ